jgi:hypothetical protein
MISSTPARESGIVVARFLVLRTEGRQVVAMYADRAMSGSDASRLEAENAKLKKLVAERDLEIDLMKEVAAKGD